MGSDLYGDNLCVIVGQQLNSRKKGVATHSWCMQKMGGNYDLTNKTTYGMGWFIPGVWSDKQDHLWYGVVYTRGMVRQARPLMVWGGLNQGHGLTSKTTYGMGWFKPGSWSDNQDHLWYGVV